MNITSLSELKNYYPSRLILQYRGKARWKELIQALVQEAWLDGLIQEEAACFDLDTAVGEQLNVIGRIVGVDRNLYGLDLTHTFFEFTDYSVSVTGIDMQIYSDSSSGPEIINTYRTTAIYTMSDFEMRTMIKLKIIFNTVARTTKALTEALYDLFGTDVSLVDNKDMSLTFTVGMAYSVVFTIADYLGIIPKSMGVSYTIT